MDSVLFFDVCLAFLFVGVGVFCSMIPLVATNAVNNRGFVYYFASGGLLAFTMNFFAELEPVGLKIPIKYASNFLSIFGFLLILTLSTVFVSKSSSAEYAPVDVEDGGLDIEIGEIEMMLSESKEAISRVRGKPRKAEASTVAQYNAFSDSYSEKFIICLSTVAVLSFLNFFIGFWFSSKEHTGYKALLLAVFNHCLLTTALSAVITSLYKSGLPSLFWPFIVWLTCSAPLGILAGTYYSHTIGDNGNGDLPSAVTDAFMHTHLKVVIHLCLCVCRGLVLYLSTICMISHAIVNKNHDRASNVFAIFCGSVVFGVMNEF